MFSNVEDLLAAHTELLADLMSLQENSMLVPSIAHTVAPHIEGMKAYAQYCGGLRRAQSLLSSKTAMSTSLANYLEVR